MAIAAGAAWSARSSFRKTALVILAMHGEQLSIACRVGRLLAHRPLPLARAGKGRGRSFQLPAPLQGDSQIVVHPAQIAGHRNIARQLRMQRFIQAERAAEEGFGRLEAAHAIFKHSEVVDAHGQLVAIGQAVRRGFNELLANLDGPLVG